MKKISLLISLIIMFVSFSGANAENTLKQPQGRIGVLNYKTEKYNPNTPVNLSAEDIKNIRKQIANKSESVSTDKKNQEIPSKQESNQLKEIQRQKIAEQKKLELQKQKEQKIADKKVAEEEKLAQKQIKEQEKIKKEQEQNEIKNKKNILSHNQNENQQKEQKIAFKFGKKDKKQNTEVTTEKNAETNKKNTENKTQENTKFVKDTDTQNIVREITSELSSGREKMLEELSTLWVSAVQKSDTVYFAIMKLSNPNGEEVNKNGFKKILEPIISAAPLVGQAFVNPALTAGSIIGSNVMGTMMNDSAKNRLAKVNDADLVILARAIDELQESLLMNYMAYKGAKEEYEFAIKIAQARQKEYEEMNKKNSSGTILANTFYTEALDNQYKARQEFLMKRVVLEQMVGSEALNEIENPKTDKQEETQSSQE